MADLSQPPVKRIVYTPSNTFEKVHADKTSTVLGVVGPVNGGKSVGMVMHLLMLALEQAPYQGVRRTKWAVVRNTYNDLKNTTIKTWQEWIPPALGEVKMTAPITSTVRIADIGDGTALEMEVLFIALDSAEDQRKLRSMDLTGMWINEAQFSDPEIVRVGEQRTGRYPKIEKDENGVRISGTGHTWAGVLLDFNMTDTEHFLYTAFMVEKRKGWKLFMQPGACIEVEDENNPGNKIWVRNPEAENIENLKEGYDYYDKKLSGMTRSQIAVDFGNKWGITAVGKPVYGDTYNDDIHVASEELSADKSLPIVMAFDWGLHPAIVFGQVLPTGQLLILKECVPNKASGVSLEELIDDYYRPLVTTHFAGIRKFVGFGDPSGRGRSASTRDKLSPFMIMKSNGVPCIPAITNNFLQRKDAVLKFLVKRNGILINPSCIWLRKGFMGAYGYKAKAGGVGIEPEKNMASHPHDALQYLALGVLNLGNEAPSGETRGGSNGTSF